MKISLPVLIVIVWAAIVASCTNVGTVIKKPCTPAHACISLSLVNKATCDIGPNDMKRMAQLNNAHPTRAIWVSYQVREDPVNLPSSPSQTYYRMRKVPPNNGQVPLDCEYVRIAATNVLYLRSYKLLSECFEDDPACGEDLIAIGTAPKSCDQNCTGPDCIHRTVPATDPLEASALRAAGTAVNGVLLTSPPGTFDLNALFGVRTVCPRREPGTIDAAGHFRSSGASCQVELPVKNGGAASALQIDIGPTVAGDITGTSAKKSMTFGPAEQDVLLHWFDATGSSIGTESIDHVSLTSNQIRITGSRRYCIWLDLPDVKKR